MVGYKVDDSDLYIVYGVGLLGYIVYIYLLGTQNKFAHLFLIVYLILLALVSVVYFLMDE